MLCQCSSQYHDIYPWKKEKKKNLTIFPLNCTDWYKGKKEKGYQKGTDALWSAEQ